MAGDIGGYGMLAEVFSWKKAEAYRAKGCEVYPYEVGGELWMMILEQGQRGKI